MKQSEILNASHLGQYIDYHDRTMGELPSAIELSFDIFNTILKNLSLCVYDIALEHNEVCTFKFRGVRIIRQDIHET